MYSAYIGGLPHAFNIIDGCNGFAGTVAVLVCLIGATFGFLVWNYPHGNTFAGDGGAYGHRGGGGQAGAAPSCGVAAVPDTADLLRPLGSS